MKKLYLIRHAKSSWSNPGLPDIERPLNKRGKRDAPFMGKLLNNVGVRPDVIITSQAKRAYRTAKTIAKEIDFPIKNIVKNNLIYEADTREFISVLKSIPDNADIAMLFGHNPGLTIVNNYLTDKYIDNIVTCGIVEIEFNINSWKDISENTGKIISYEYPKKYLK